MIAYFVAIINRYFGIWFFVFWDLVFCFGIWFFVLGFGFLLYFGIWFFVIGSWLAAHIESVRQEINLSVMRHVVNVVPYVGVFVRLGFAPIT